MKRKIRNIIIGAGLLAGVSCSAVYLVKLINKKRQLDNLEDLTDDVNDYVNLKEES